MSELQSQLLELEEKWQEVAIGRRFKQKRKTLQKQMDRVRMQQSQVTTSANDDATPLRQCRTCGETTCSGRCWGFYSLKRKELLEQQRQKPSSIVPNPQTLGNKQTPNSQQPLTNKPRRREQMIDVNNLTFAYGGKAPIFNDFNLTVKRGEAWSVIGPSGCGKTTFLYLLAGLYRPSAGTVQIEGAPVLRPRPRTGLRAPALAR